jgi:hypothetical protein
MCNSTGQLGRMIIVIRLNDGLTIVIVIPP